MRCSLARSRVSGFDLDQAPAVDLPRTCPHCFGHKSGRKGLATSGRAVDARERVHVNQQLEI